MVTWEEEIGATLVTFPGSSVLPELQLGFRPNSVAQRCYCLQQPGPVKLGAEVNIGDLELIFLGIHLD